MMRLTYFTLTLLQGFIFKHDREAPARNIRQSLFHGKAVRYPVFRLFLLFEDRIVYSYPPEGQVTVVDDGRRPLGGSFFTYLTNQLIL